MSFSKMADSSVKIKAGTARISATCLIEELRMTTQITITSTNMLMALKTARWLCEPSKEA